MEELKNDLIVGSDQEKAVETPKEPETVSSDYVKELEATNAEMLGAMQKLNDDRKKYKNDLLALKKSKGIDPDSEIESDEDKEDRIANKILEQLKPVLTQRNEVEEDVSKKFESRLAEIKNSYSNQPKQVSNVSTSSNRDNVEIKEHSPLITDEVRKNMNKIQQATGMSIKDIEAKYLSNLNKFGQEEN